MAEETTTADSDPGQWRAWCRFALDIDEPDDQATRAELLRRWDALRECARDLVDAVGHAIAIIEADQVRQTSAQLDAVREALQRATTVLEA